MPFDPAIAGICATGVTKLVDTAIGEKCIHHAHRIADPRERRDSSQSRSRDGASSPVQERKSEEDWSRKTYFRRKRHQQRHQPRGPSPEAQYEPPAPPLSKDERRAAEAREQRCDAFRDAKNRYVPTAPHPAAPVVAWNEERVNADVERAVREATRKASREQARLR